MQAESSLLKKNCKRLSYEYGWILGPDEIHGPTSLHLLSAREYCLIVLDEAELSYIRK
jgi:hypothetical protein